MDQNVAHENDAIYGTGKKVIQSTSSGLYASTSNNPCNPNHMFIWSGGGPCPEGLSCACGKTKAHWVTCSHCGISRLEPITVAIEVADTKMNRLREQINEALLNIPIKPEVRRAIVDSVVATVERNTD